MPTIQTKLWLSVAAVFAAGALAVNAVWVYSYNDIDRRHVAQIDALTSRYAARSESLERSHKRQLGEMRNRVEVKVDRVLEKLERMPTTPIVIEARQELESVRSDD